MSKVIEINYLLILYKFVFLRNEKIGLKDFRKLVEEIFMLMVYEVIRDLSMEEVEVKILVVVIKCKMFVGKKIVVVFILRVGFGMVDGVFNLILVVKVGYIGLYRDEKIF